MTVGYRMTLMDRVVPKFMFALEEADISATNKINSHRLLDIKKNRYELIHIGTMSLSENQVAYYSCYDNKPSNDLMDFEKEFLYIFCEEEKIQWAIRNSFSGLYISRMKDYSDFSVKYRLAVYMRSEHATYWRLKFSQG